MKGQMSELTLIPFEHSTVMKRSDGIIEVICVDNTEYEVHQIKEILDAFGALGESKRQPILIKTAPFNSITSEAREYCASEEATQFSIAEAYVITALSLKIVANFYLKMNKPPVPTKFFNCEEDAVAWLKTFVS